MKKKLVSILAVFGLMVLIGVTTRAAMAKDASSKTGKTNAPGAAGTSNAAQTVALADIDKTFGFVPHFFADFPALVLPGTWEEMKTLQMNPKTALPNKVKELIGLGVSSQ